MPHFLGREIPLVLLSRELGLIDQFPVLGVVEIKGPQTSIY